MDRPHPLITAVVYARDHEPHVVGALESVVGQDHDALELVVVDGGSSDRTVGVVRDYLDRAQVRSRFRRAEVIELTAASTVPAAINRGIRESRGDYLNPLIGNEQFAPGRLSALLRACTSSGAGLAFSRVEPIAGAGAPSAAELEHVYSVQDTIEFFPTVGYALLRHACSLSSGNLFFSRDLFERVGDFANLPDAYDWDFLLRCLLVTEPVFVPDPLYSCRLLGEERFIERQARVAAAAAGVLRNYYFLCRNRFVENRTAPSPAWGPFFTSFVTASRHGQYLVKP